MVKNLAPYAGRFSEYNVYVRSSGYPKVALVYPSTYQASISNLFTHIAYFYLLEKSDALVDRFTLDNPDRGSVTERKLREFDLILASANYELDLLYLVKLLSDAGVEVFAERRRMRPLIIVGGLAAMSNPEPFLDVADASFIGDGEVLLQRLIRCLSALPENPRAFLDSLGGEAYTGEAIAKKAVVEDLNNSFHPTAEIRSKKVEPVFGEGFYVEISRGCRWLCRFCLEAYSMYPYRYRNLETVMKLVSEGLRHVERKRVVVYSSSPFDHPGIRDLLKYFIENEIDFSLPSIRWDTVKLDDLEVISRSTQKTLTLAPETMSSNLGCSIGKCFNFDVFGELVGKAFREGFNVKLYIMTGFPQESEEDLQETSRNLKKLLVLSHELNRKLTVNVNPLIPKPHTPLQDAPLLAEKEYSKRVKLLEVELGRSTVTHLRWLYAFAQSLVALGDRRIGRLLALLAYRNLSKRDIADLAGTLKVDISFPLKRRSRDERPWSRVVFPLDHIIDRVSPLGKS